MVEPKGKQKENGDSFGNILNKSVSDIIDVRNQIEERLKLLEQREEHWQEVKQEMKKNKEAAPNKIVLDIGGQRFATSKSTLLKFKDSLFAQYIAVNSPESDGSYFFDRNSSNFDRIMDYLSGELDTVGLDVKDVDKLRKDFQYYKLTYPSPPSTPSPPSNVLMEPTRAEDEIMPSTFFNIQQHS
jgi:hypothetical protein